jgi:hypothetical protein
MWESKESIRTCHACNLPCRSYISYSNNIIICKYCQEKEATDIRIYLIIKKLKEENPIEYHGGYEYDPDYDY